MVLQTFETTYTIIHSGKSKEQMPVYLCRKESDGKLYQIFCMEKRFLMEETIFFLNEQLNRKEFAEFHDMFLKEECLYVAMCYHEGTTLADLLEQEELKEFEARLEVGRKVLEAFLLTKMPVFFRCQCLQKENIIVTESLEVSFSYSLDHVELAAGMKEKDYYYALAEFFTGLWSKELKAQNIAEMKEFIGNLNREAERNGIDSTLTGNADADNASIYQSYLAVSKSLSSMPHEERKKPKGKLLNLWNKIKKTFPVCKKIIAILLLCLMIGYLIYTIWECTQPSNKQMDLIRSIGTLDLKE